MKFIKEHKILLAIVIMLLIIIVSLIILLCVLSKSVGNDEYGNRLDGIENYEIGSTQVTEIKDDIGSLEGVNKVNYSLKGRLVNVLITVSDSLSTDTAKEYAIKVLSHLDDDQKSYYDVQAFVVSDNEESENYPIIGYKSKSGENMIWKK